MADGQHGAARTSGTRANALALVGYAVVLSACAGGSMRGQVASAEQRSTAEYDLARDAFQNTRLREALAHVEKAL